MAYAMLLKSGSMAKPDVNILARYGITVIMPFCSLTLGNTHGKCKQTSHSKGI